MSSILIVDDSVDNAELLEFVLREEGYLIRTLFSGVSLLLEVELFKPSLIILDIRVRELDGIQLAKEIKNVQSNRNVKLILYSASLSKEDGEKISKKFCDFFISKPYDIDEMVHNVKRLLA